MARLTCCLLVLSLLLAGHAVEPSGPTVTTGQNISYTLPGSKPLTLHCDVEGAKMVNITWLKLRPKSNNHTTVGFSTPTSNMLYGHWNVSDKTNLTMINSNRSLLHFEDPTTLEHGCWGCRVVANTSDGAVTTIAGPGPNNTFVTCINMTRQPNMTLKFFQKPNGDVMFTCTVVAFPGVSLILTPHFEKGLTSKNMLRAWPYLFTKGIRDTIYLFLNNSWLRHLHNLTCTAMFRNITLEQSFTIPTPVPEPEPEFSLLTATMPAEIAWPIIVVALVLSVALLGYLAYTCRKGTEKQPLLPRGKFTIPRAKFTRISQNSQ